MLAELLTADCSLASRIAKFDAIIHGQSCKLLHLALQKSWKAGLYTDLYTSQLSKKAHNLKPYL